jgi:hypothetical protein
MTWAVWGKGLAAAFVSAAATAAAGAVATKLSDLRGLGAMALVAGIMGAVLYLRQSPLPDNGEASTVASDKLPK